MSLDKWEGQFGNDYLERNMYDPIKYAGRGHFFRELAGALNIGSILEVGCNRGINLAEIKKYTPLLPFGIEPNRRAVAAALEDGHFVVSGRGDWLPWPDDSFDLVFTCGVLMHQKDPTRVMREMERVSRRYILAIEYKGSGEMVPYRGEMNMLWKRPNYPFGGELIRHDALGYEFDDCHYWLYQK